MSILEFWKNDVKMYDLTVNLSHLTPPWPTYEPLQLSSSKISTKWSKRTVDYHLKPCWYTP